MQVKNVSDAKKFDPVKLIKANLFESERMFCDLYCVAPGQEQKAHVHEESDKLYFVLEGCGLFRVNGEEREVGEKNVVCVPSGAEHSVRNNSPANLVLLVYMAPHPNYVRKSVSPP